MTKGFVTIATGSLKYYKLAFNLCFSYKTSSKQHLPFAIICDRKNKYTDLFDKVIVIDNPYKSVYDKFHLLNNCCFDEMIFIESDCLIFGDINYLFDFYSSMDDKTFFSGLGDVMALDSKGGWFTKEGAGEFKNTISYCLSLHGGILFIRRNEKLKNFLNLCYHILNNYSSYVFHKDNVCDESIFSLAMAVFGCKPINPLPGKILVVHEEQYKFDYRSYKFYKHDSFIVHYGNLFTISPSYLSSFDKIVCLNERKKYKPSFTSYVYRWVRFRVYMYLRYFKNKMRKKRKIQNG